MTRATQTNQDANASHAAKHKNVPLAVVLNCIPPCGLGLAYLGRWKLALANSLVFLLIIVGCMYANEPSIVEHIHWVVMVLMVGSGSLAHGVAKSPA